MHNIYTARHEIVDVGHDEREAERKQTRSGLRRRRVRAEEETSQIRGRAETEAKQSRGKAETEKKFPAMNAKQQARAGTRRSALLSRELATNECAR